MMNESQTREPVAEPSDRARLDAALVTAMEVTLTRYFRTIRHVVEQAASEEKITLAQFRCLQAIAARGTTLTTRLAEQMRVTMPTMTSRIDGLVERGLVERQPDPQSRRQIQLRLTPAGAALLASYQTMMNEWLSTFLAPLDEGQKRRLLAALEDIGSLLDADLNAPSERDAAAVEKEK